MTKPEMISKDQARVLWEQAVAHRSWQDKVIQKVMFDMLDLKGSSYTVSWRSVDPNDTEKAIRRDFEEVLRKLIEEGEQRSSLWRGKGKGKGKVSFVPMPVSELEVAQAIVDASEGLHPECVHNEQVLTCALLGKLPARLTAAFGTPACAVHPERNTAKPKDGQPKKYGTGRNSARYDLGFGHPTVDEGIEGLVEIKEGATIEGLRAGLSNDLLKLTDDGVPPDAFRISWLVLSNRANPDEALVTIHDILRHVSATSWEDKQTEPGTKWRLYQFPNGSKLRLAWYHAVPKGKLTPLWA
ncbi:MAG: hypothetical protein JKY65_31385 [Planctomycetes bacterium]|nr:hypothetical protein [Planctomycetota bacterium]